MVTPVIRDDLIDEALLEYSEAWFAGRRLDPEAFCQDHPKCDMRLRSLINGFVLVANGLREMTGDEPSERAAQNGQKGSPLQGEILGDFRVVKLLGRGGMAESRYFLAVFSSIPALDAAIAMRVDSRFLLPNQGRCLIRLLPKSGGKR